MNPIDIENKKWLSSCNSCGSDVICTWEEAVDACSVCGSQKTTVVKYEDNE